MELDENEEAIHHDHIIRSFTSYRYQHLAANNLRRQSFMSLSAQHQALLPDQQTLINSIDECIVNNAEFLEDLAAHASDNSFFFNADSDSREQRAALLQSKPKPKVTSHEMEKVRSTLRQLHRDWSDEGRVEREKAYGPVLDAIEHRYGGLADADRRKVRVLVPGCGLGRLPFEIAARGFAAQGNEFSLFMLFASNYILNASRAAHEFSIHPFCHSLSNVDNVRSALRDIHIPDVLPSDELQDSDFSMAAGDFCEIYRDEHGQWDCVATCFFVDTARNIVQYIETIRNLLKPGGCWVNLGPSLWHWEGNSGGSIDIPMDELKAVARRLGFQISDERKMEMSYTGNPASNMHYTYIADFWTATLS